MKTLFDSVKKNIKSFFKRIGTFIKIRKKVFLYGLLVFASSLGVSSTALMTSTYFKNNIPISLREIAIEYSKENKENPNIIIYPHQIVTAYQNTSSHQAELSKTVRSVLYNETCFDLYMAKWNNRFSPGVVNYLDQSDIHISFLMFPKQSYTYRYWKYEMPLIYPDGQTPLLDLASPNDIYINKQYADKLLFDLGLPQENYSQLYQKSVTIPYGWKNNSERKDYQIIDTDYVIKGIIDSESDEYKKYSSLFGDFFITDEYFSFPFVSQTFLTLSDLGKCTRYFPFLLKQYNYESDLSSFSSNDSLLSFQYRISFFGNLNGDYGLNNVEYNPHKYCKKTDLVFEAFSTSSYIVYIAIYLILNIVSLLFLTIASKYFLSFALNDHSPQKNKGFYSILFLLSIILGVPFGIITQKAFHLSNATLKALSSINFAGTLIYLFELLLFVIGFLIMLSSEKAKMFFKKKYLRTVSNKQIDKNEDEFEKISI